MDAKSKLLIGALAASILLTAVADQRSSATYTISHETLTASLDTASSATYELTTSVVPLAEQNSPAEKYELIAGSPLVIPEELTAPFLTATILNAGNIQFVINGPSGHRVALEYSPDLDRWTRLQTNTIQSTTVPYGAPAFVGQGFFRAVLVE